jgi:hypothetical protein
VALLALLALFLAGPAAARQGDSRAVLYVGTTRFLVDDATSDGTIFGGNWGFEVLDDLLWNFGASVSTTDGVQTVNNRLYDIYARTSQAQTSLTYYFGGSSRNMVVPFLGAGIAALNYDIDYTFPGSMVGKTSGTGPGAFGLGGVELWLTRSSTLILEVQGQGYEIETEAHKKTTLRSSGFLLSLRIGIHM